MKFVQLRYRERQSDWFAKRELSWHISSVITRDNLGKTRVLSYSHLFYSCSQDWYAVTKKKRQSGKEKVSHDDEDDQPSLFVCSEDGCNCKFNSFLELELHIEAGIHKST